MPNNVETKQLEKKVATTESTFPYSCSISLHASGIVEETQAYFDNR